jgi:hypothetical protein
MRAFLLLFALLASASAESGRAYVSELGRRVLARTDQIVVASVTRVTPPFRGIVTARLRVKERIHGFDPSEEIVLLYVEDFLAPSAMGSTLERMRIRTNPTGVAEASGKPVAPGSATVGRTRDSAGGGRGFGESGGVRLAEGAEGTFFLRRGASTYAIVGYFASRDPLAPTKTRRLREILEVEAAAAIEDRAARLRRLCLASLDDADPWIRANGARELRALAARFPNAFAPDDARRLAEARAREGDLSVRADLERAVLALDRKLGARLALEAEAREAARFSDALATEARLLAASPDPLFRVAEMPRLVRQYGIAATRVLVPWLADSDAEVRAAAARAIAAAGGPSAREALRAALAREASASAAAAMIEGLGALADEDAVDLLAAKLDDPALEREALGALARIGGPSARAAVAAFRARARGESRRLAEALLEEEFTDEP